MAEDKGQICPLAKDTNTPNGNRLSTTISILAMIVAIAVAFLRPVSHSVDNLTEHLEKHEVLHGHPGVLADLNSINEKFIGIENKLSSLSESIDKQNGDFERRLIWLEELAIESVERDARGHAIFEMEIAALKERIEILERGP